MIWKDKRIAVVDVKEGPRLDAEGVRDGWDATTDDALAARMFYPADMFAYEPCDSAAEHPGTWIEAHDCASCVECIHDGAKCCGCYDGVCCKPTGSESDG
jgi:hypothetical protein